jgi:alternate signal-mediated exported protein
MLVGGARSVAKWQRRTSVSNGGEISGGKVHLSHPACSNHAHFAPQNAMDGFSYFAQQILFDNK